MKVRGGNRENVFVLANFQSLSDLNRHKFLKRSIESLVEPFHSFTLSPGCKSDPSGYIYTATVFYRPCRGFNVRRDPSTPEWHDFPNKY